MSNCLKERNVFDERSDFYRPDKSDSLINSFFASCIAVLSDREGVSDEQKRTAADLVAVITAGIRKGAGGIPFLYEVLGWNKFNFTDKSMGCGFPGSKCCVGGIHNPAEKRAGLGHFARTVKPDTMEYNPSFIQFLYQARHDLGTDCRVVFRGIARTSLPCRTEGIIREATEDAVRFFYPQADIKWGLPIIGQFGGEYVYFSHYLNRLLIFGINEPFHYIINLIKRRVFSVTQSQ